MTTLAPGDIAITSYYADGADATTDNFSFVSLVPLAAGTVIYFTDAGWVTTGGFFGATEDVVTYTVPAGGLPAGSVITLNGLSFNVNGDSIIAYQAPTATTGPFTNIFGVDFADSNTTWAPEAINTTNLVPPGGADRRDHGPGFWPGQRRLHRPAHRHAGTDPGQYRQPGQLDPDQQRHAGDPAPDRLRGRGDGP